MKKAKILLLLMLVTCMMLLFVACYEGVQFEACSHLWESATCTSPKTCAYCEKTEGSALGHTWADATCTEPKTCVDCDETKGEALGHTWIDATCTEPKTCVDCDETEGEALGHAWVDATCTEAKTCSVCSVTEGEALGHWFKDATCTEPKTCVDCDETEGEALGHDYEESVTREANCKIDGEKIFSCSRCDNYYTESFAMQSYTSTEIYDMSVSSVGEIITYKKSGDELALGTGFVYSSDGKIVTNYHVIEDAYSAKITINEITYVVRKVLAYDKTLDLAVLKINAAGLIPLRICEETHSTGSTVYAFGSSKGMTATFSQGIITHSRRDVDGVTCVQHDAAISSGNSGGPLINQYGEVIGINTWTIRDSQNLNFAISAEELDQLSYGEALTVREFYEKECDPYVLMKEYIIENGTYYSGSNGDYYKLLLGVKYSSDYSDKYSRYAYYYIDDGTITLDFLINDGEYWAYFSMDEKLDGSYSWYYFDEGDHRMNGTIYGSTFNDNILLGYTYNNITNSTLRSTTRELASTMLSVLCSWIDTDFEIIGVSAEDLGFIYY